MRASLGARLRVFDEEPQLGPRHPEALTRQVWAGGMAHAETRGVDAAAARWLLLEDLSAVVDQPETGPAPVLAWDLDQLVPGDLASPEGAGGLVLVSMDIEPAIEDEFNDWYTTEHIPLLRAVPGMITARRFRARRGSPRYVAIYHVEDSAIYASRTWVSANETPWMLRMRRFQRNRTYLIFDRPLTAG